MSRLIKSGWAAAGTHEKKVISIKILENAQPEIEDIEEDFSFQTEEERQKIIEQAHNEAEAIIAAAKLKADEITQQVNFEKESWEQEKLILAENAREIGYNEGLEQGRVQGYEEYHENILFAKSVVDSSKGDYREKLESSQATILDLGIKVAEKILGHELTGQEEEFLTIVKRALREAREYREIQLHVHPVHYGFLLNQKEEILKIFPKETEIFIFPDDSLQEHSCIIESANGRIDASVDSQIEVIKAKLFELLESETS